MTNVVDYFLYPMTWLVIGFFIIWWKWSRLTRNGRKVCVIFMILLTYATSTPFLPAKLNAYLEDQYPPLSIRNLDTALPYRIVVLGGGMGYDDRLPANSLLEPVMLVRLVEGIRLYRKLPHSMLVTSGNSSIGRKELALVVREAAILTGVDSGRISVLPEPTNTQQEAAEYVKYFGKDYPVIVATSATHMPRAIFLFKNAGINTVYAAPTYFQVKRQNPVSTLGLLKPDFGYWGNIQASLHEIAGMVYIRHFSKFVKAGKKDTQGK
jgi:uncharacterized SAM-binding protein YcdF (DUF218 family)